MLILTGIRRRQAESCVQINYPAALKKPSTRKGFQTSTFSLCYKPLDDIPKYICLYCFYSEEFSLTT